MIVVVVLSFSQHLTDNKNKRRAKMSHDEYLELADSRFLTRWVLILNNI